MTKDFYVSDNFKASEFYCHCAYKDCNAKDDELIDPSLVMVLQDVREHFGKPIQITSGLRCRQHNKVVGGAVSSRHVPEYGGYAADFKVKGINADDVAEYLEKKYPTKYGIGRYRGRTHLDTRQTKGRWDYR